MSAALATFALRHGRGLVLVAFAFALAGLLLIPQIPISIFPQTDFPRIVILVDNGIAPPNIQMTTVTRPIEEAIRLVPGVTTVRSVTARGSTEISVFFRWDVDILNALHLVQGRISQITPTLPPECRFYINRLTFSVFPMVGFSITSPSRKTSELWDLAYYEISPRLYRLEGVAETRIVGGRAPEYHVIVDPRRLNAFNMPLTRVVDAIRNANILQPAGMLQENYHLYLTAVTGLMKKPEQIENTVVDVVKGNPVKVKDIASVIPGERPTYNIVTANGRPAVLINVLQQPDGNAVKVADAVNAELAEIRKTLPKDIELSTYYDQSILVRESISGVVESILIGLALSVGVLLAFLGNWRATLVAALVIPIAVLIAIIGMRLFHMGFNLMTLGGIAACIGVVIDDAIVVVENIAVHLYMGQKPRDAARSAITELTPALIGSTLTPIVVFVPLVFLGGITAVFFRALALALVASLFASLLLALLFTPVLSAWLLRPAATALSAEDAETAGEGRVMRALNVRYQSALLWSLSHPKVIAGVVVLVLASCAGLYLELGSGFLPEMDEGAFVLDYRTPAGTSLQETDRILGKIETILRETPEIESYSRRTGARLALAIAEPNTGDFLIKLKSHRSRSVEEVTSELRAKITGGETALPELEFPHILEDLVGDLAWSPQPIEVKITHPDEAVYKAVAKEVEEWLPKVQGVVDIVNQTIVIGPAINFRVDPEKASRAGFSASDVANIEASLLDGQLASTMIRGNRRIGIRVRYAAENRKTAEQLQALLLTSPTGATVPLASIASMEVEQGQTEIRRENLHDLSAVTARLEHRDLGSAMQEIQRRLPKEVKLPPGTGIEYGGLYQVQQESFVALTQVLLMSMVLIFVILIFEFRSFAHPFAILLATVLCTSGSLLALLATGQTLNIASFMGIIMVIGIVHKNGILMLDSEQHFTETGLPLKEAVYQAGRRRLRPILMTALATVFGMLPLALGAGSGAQLLRPLAIAVIGGVTVSMALSLIITPVVFSMVRRDGRAVEPSL
ncbi:MAG: efflux RND transporter permease subunit [Bryobacteraceae bacterium]